MRRPALAAVLAAAALTIFPALAGTATAAPPPGTIPAAQFAAHAHGNERVCTATPAADTQPATTES